MVAILEFGLFLLSEFCGPTSCQVEHDQRDTFGECEFCREEDVSTDFSYQML